MDRTLDEGIYTLNEIKRMTQLAGSISLILDSTATMLFNEIFEGLYLKYLDENIAILRLLKTNPSIETVIVEYDTLQITYTTLSQLKEEIKDNDVLKSIKTVVSLYETVFNIVYPFVKEYRNKYFQ